MGVGGGVVGGSSRLFVSTLHVYILEILSVQDVYTSIRIYKKGCYIFHCIENSLLQTLIC